MDRSAAAALAPLLAGDPALRNEFALLPVAAGATAVAQRFVAWATGPAGRELIRGFGVERFGAPLFFPLVMPEPT